MLHNCHSWRGSRSELEQQESHTSSVECLWSPWLTPEPQSSHDSGAEWRKGWECGTYYLLAMF